MRELNIEILPEEVKRELFEFYEFLLKKYKIKEKRIKDLEKEILADQIQIDTKGWKFNREEIYER